MRPVNDPEKRHEALAVLGSVDKTIHEPSRLMILGILSLVAEADFLFLLKQTGLTRGNLSTHLRKLEDAGFIAVRKEFVNRMPHTVLTITPKGSTGLKAYRAAMEQAMSSIGA